MTSIVDPLQVSRFLHGYDDAAAKEGIRLSIGLDFNEYVAIARNTPTKSPTHPIFRPDRSPIKYGEGYWIMGVDKNEDVVLMEGARLYDLSHSNFAEHLESLKAFYADPAIHAHPQDRCTCTAPSAKEITGKVAYHGDLWVRSDFRGRGIPKITTGIGRGVTLAMWAPDFVCWLVRSCALDKSFHRLAHHERGGATLQLVQEDIVDDYWLIWRTYSELRSHVDRQDRGGRDSAP